MSVHGALAENTRRNERVERGSSVVTGSLVLTVTQPMRKITGFQLTIDNSNAVIVTGDTVLDPALVTGSLNAAGTQLTIQVWKFHSSSDPRWDVSAVATTVQWQYWGNLSAGAGF